jgi:tetratricopeptide (TPR) repeat protein
MARAESEVDSATEAAYWSHRHLLPLRERRLIEASRGDSGRGVQRRQLEAIVASYPDYWPAWWVLADNLFHYYPRFGSSGEDARVSLERLVALNPKMIMAWRHLAEACSAQRDTAGLARALEAIDRLGGGQYFLREQGVDFSLHLRASLALRRREPAAEGMMDSIYRSALEPGRNLFFPTRWFLLEGFPALQIDLNRRFLRQRTLSDEDAQGTAEQIGYAWLTRGAWDSAQAVFDSLAAVASDTVQIFENYRRAVIGAWLGDWPLADAEQRRADATRLVAQRSPGYQAEVFWLDGLLGVLSRDSQAVSAARAGIRRTGAVAARYLDRSLEAFEFGLRGDRKAAGTAMAALEWEIPWWETTRATPHPGLRGVNRIAAAQWLAATGDGAQASRLLRWVNAAIGPHEAAFTFRSRTWLLSARIEAALGNVREARLHYERFLDQYDRTGTEGAEVVVQARQELARLGH